MNTKTASKIQTKLNLYLNPVISAGLGLLLVLSPLMRGLFFAPDLLLAQISLGILALLLAIQIYAENGKINSKAALVWSGLVVMYWVTVKGAVNVREGIGEAGKITAYWLVYLLACWLFSHRPGFERSLRNSIFWGAVLAAAVGWLAYIQIWEFPGALWDRRMNGTIQYPNTFALLCLVGLIAAWEKLKEYNLLAAAGSVLLIMSILASLSRGVWLLVFPVLFVYVLLMDRQERGAFIINFSLLAILALLSFREIKLLLAADAQLKATLVLGLALVLAAVWQVLCRLGERYWRDNRWNYRTKRALQAGLIIFVGSLLVSLVAAGFSGSLFTQDVAQRAGKIDAGQTSYRGRLLYIQAAVKIARDYPLGAGGGGWDRLYHRYMEGLNWTTETHSFPAKILVEAGWPGLLLYLGFSLILWWKVYQRVRNRERVWLSVAWSAIWLHSLLDFDLSMGALGMIFMAMAAGLEAGEKAEASGWRWQPAISLVLLLISGGGIILSYRLYFGGEMGAQGAMAMTRKDWILARQRLELARQYDPYQATFAADLAQTYAILAYLEKEPDRRKQADAMLNSALALDGDNIRVRMVVARVEILLGRPERAVQHLERLLVINPWWQDAYELMARAYLEKGKLDWQSGKPEQARKEWQQVAGIVTKVKEMEAPPAYSGLTRPRLTTYLRAQELIAEHFLGQDRSEQLKELVKKKKDLQAEINLHLDWWNKWRKRG